MESKGPRFFLGRGSGDYLGGGTPKSTIPPDNEP